MNNRTNKLYYLLTLPVIAVVCFLLMGCPSAKVEVLNDIPIEMRVIGILDQEIAKKEIEALLKGINFKDGFRVPTLTVIDATFDTDSTKQKKVEIKVPLAQTDVMSLELSGNVLDKATYDNNLDEALENYFDKDTSFATGLSILTGKKGKNILSNKLPKTPLLPNEFIISTGSQVKSDPIKQIFRSSEELILYIEQSKLDIKDLIVYYLAGKSLESLKDTDGDSVTDDIDRCPNEPGTISCAGCKCPSDDIDGDGVKNDLDNCKTEAGAKDNNGCPWPDSDRDGTPDKFDKCPEPGKCNGCECPKNDKDSDGIKNEVDKCPDEAGPSSNDGCPLKPEISHDNNEGKFYFKNVDFQKQTVELTIKLNDGTTKIVYPQNRSYPNVGEYDNLTRELTQAAGITVIIKVIDKASKTPVLSTPFIRNDLSLVCLKPEPGADKKCGFMNTDL